jgi:peptidoglycan/xylan/chitin deacetylase (PgdA/CDA1 family)
MQGPATSTNRRATALALALVVMATLAGCTGTQRPATRAGGAQAAGPASQDPQGRPHATPATPEPEPLLPPPPPPDAVNLPSGRLAPVYYKVPTTQPVVFLTIDDGWTPSLPVLELLRARHLPVAVFLVDRAWRRDPAYFRALQAAGATVEDHTLTHPVLSRLPLARQEREVCGGAAGEAAGFGTRPTLLRPPFGAFDRATLLAAHACGLTAVVEWTATVNDGHLVAVGGRLRPGYVVLLHFRPGLLGDLTAALGAIRRAHLTVGRLSSYLVPRT